MMSGATSKGEIAILAENDYQDQELWVPLYRLREAGYETVVVGPRADGRSRRLDEDGAALQAILRGEPTRYRPVHEEAGEDVTIFGVTYAAGRCRWMRPDPPAVR